MGSVLFVGAGAVLAQDNANLFWDDTNNRLGIGTAAPTHPLTVELADGGTAAVSTVVTIKNNSTGTPAAGFGSAIRWQLESDTTNDQDAAKLDVLWATATHASRKARVVFNVFDTASREALRLEADGSNALLGMGNIVQPGIRLTVYPPGAAGQGVQIRGVAAQTGELLQATEGTASTMIWQIDAIGTETIRPLDAVTATATRVLTLGHRSSGTPAVGFGTGVRWQGETSTSNDRDMLGLDVTWVVATETSQKARAVFNIYDTAAREVLRFEASGTAAMIGFLNAAAVPRTAPYTITNGVTDRSYNANATTIDELADIIFTLVSDLQLFGLLG